MQYAIEYETTDGITVTCEGMETIEQALRYKAFLEASGAVDARIVTQLIIINK